MAAGHPVSLQPERRTCLVFLVTVPKFGRLAFMADDAADPDHQEELAKQKARSALPEKASETSDSET